MASPPKKQDFVIESDLAWKNLTLTNNDPPTSFFDDKAMRMMQKMGYKSGSGLGKSEQGRVKVIEVPIQLGKRGFGLKVAGGDQVWDFAAEEITVRDKAIWLRNDKSQRKSYKVMRSWMKEGAKLVDIDQQVHFCDEKVLEKVLKAKNIFDELPIDELNVARSKSNAFETVRSVFFMNRAALKMANIDAATGFMFTKIDKNRYHESHKPPFYFADVCAGPGGFTEYILWRKKWAFKGYGFTLKESNDFRVADSLCASPVTFQAFYGATGDGNVCNPKNIRDFRDKVLFDTEGSGVHFMMADGGFSVEGEENLQEVLSKHIYLAQCLVALEIVRTNGHFVTKMFDVFTEFSAGLLYLMHQCFEKVAILKPNSSRPANSERYFIGCRLKDKKQVADVRKYLCYVAHKLWEIKDDPERDVVETVPLDLIKGDELFFQYLYDSNNTIGLKQCVALDKLAAFCRNPSLLETRQDELRKKSLEYWNIPDKPKIALPALTIEDLLQVAIDKPEVLSMQAREVNTIENLEVTLTDLEDWKVCPLFSSRKTNNCNFYAGLGSTKVHRLQCNKWVKVKNLQLVRGTLLYGEFVKETADADCNKYSLHVIDAIRLGDRSLAELRFKERMKLIESYCKAVNKEFQANVIRVRPKLIDKLSNLLSNDLIQKADSSYFSVLPKIGYQSLTEQYPVNSILLLKCNQYQTFNFIFVLRVQIFLEDEQQSNALSFDKLLYFIKQKV